MWKCFGSACQRDHLLLAWQVHRRPRLLRECSRPYGTRCIVAFVRVAGGSIRGEPVLSFPDVALPRLCRPGAFAAGRGAGRGATALALQSGFTRYAMLGPAIGRLRGRKRHRRCFGRRTRYWPSRASRASPCGSGLGTSCAAGVWAQWGKQQRASRCSSKGLPSAAPRVQLAVAIFSHDARGGLWDGGAAGRRAQSARRGRQVG